MPIRSRWVVGVYGALVALCTRVSTEGAERYSKTTISNLEHHALLNYFTDAATESNEDAPLAFARESFIEVELRTARPSEGSRFSTM